MEMIPEKFKDDWFIKAISAKLQIYGSVRNFIDY